MRIAFSIFVLMTTLAASTGDGLLERGRDELRAGQYAEAERDLRKASDAFVTNDQLTAYVRSGHFPSLAKYETTLVYLTLAYVKLGREADAREALRRISVAERIEPTYQTLPLDVDAAPFEAVAEKLLPEMPLPPNQALAELRSGKHRRNDVA